MVIPPAASPNRGRSRLKEMLVIHVLQRRAQFYFTFILSRLRCLERATCVCSVRVVIAQFALLIILDASTSIGLEFACLADVQRMRHDQTTLVWLINYSKKPSVKCECPEPDERLAAKKGPFRRSPCRPCFFASNMGPVHQR